MYRRSQRWMLIINNRFLSLYDYNFLLVIEKIFSVNSKICLYDFHFLLNSQPFFFSFHYFFSVSRFFLGAKNKNEENKIVSSQKDKWNTEKSELWSKTYLGTPYRLEIHKEKAGQFSISQSISRLLSHRNAEMERQSASAWMTN